MLIQIIYSRMQTINECQTCKHAIIISFPIEWFLCICYYTLKDIGRSGLAALEHAVSVGLVGSEPPVVIKLSTITSEDDLTKPPLPWKQNHHHQCYYRKYKTQLRIRTHVN